MQIGRRPFPWVTFLAIGLALIAWFGPRAIPAAWIYDRTAILHGEIWRLWTGNLVHFSASHLGWNSLVVGLSGSWVERGELRGGRRLWIVAPPAIGLALLVGAPSAAFFGGLSGMAMACTTFACLSEWRHRRAPRPLWGAALLLIAAKVAWEMAGGEPVFARFNGGAVHPAPLSHLAGVAAALACHCAFDRRHGLGRCPSPPS